MTNMDFVSPDNYKVIRRIGVGAMGNVYEGYERGVYYNFALRATGLIPYGERDIMFSSIIVFRQ